jgi:8-oxo-dGTP pyrophosphatase MutT (NUDIX family)
MIEKVSAFILRPGKSGSDILIFEHPYSGLQIPAGTVEVGESCDDAIVREIQEETGLRHFEVIQKLAEDQTFTEADEAILTQTMRCFAWPAQTAQRIGPLCTRGMRMKTFERKVGFTHINFEEYDLNREPAKRLETLDGWLPSEFLTREIRRHYYEVRVLEETRETWSQIADQNLTFQLKWAPLNPKPALYGEQSLWLNYLGKRE